MGLTIGLNKGTKGIGGLEEDLANTEGGLGGVGGGGGAAIAQDSEASGCGSQPEPREWFIAACAPPQPGTAHLCS